MDCPSLPYFLTSRLRWVDRVDTWIHQLWYGVENLVHWFPYIWRDRDWDHHFCSDILRHKLLRMAALHEKYGHGLHANRYAKQMRVCAELLRRVEADEYDEALFKFHGVTFWSASPELRSLVYRQVAKRQKAELEYCFKLMSKHYLGWWD